MKPVDLSKLAIFSGNAHPQLARRIISELGTELTANLVMGKAEIGSFEDGECKVQFHDNVRGKDVFIVQPTNQPDRNQTELELMVMAIRSSAERITAVIPYSGYARQDRKDRPRVPNSIVRVFRNIAQTGVDGVILLDLHSLQSSGILEAANPQLRYDVLFARPVILDWLSGQDLQQTTLMPVDIGGAKMVETYMNRLHQMGYPVNLAFVHKSGTSSRGIERVSIIGEKIEGQRIIFIDDMIATASSADIAAREAARRGAAEIWVVAIHPVLPNPASCQRIMDSPINRLITTDTLPIRQDFQGILKDKLTVISVGRLLALAIKHLHFGDSMSALFEVEGYRAG